MAGSVPAGKNHSFHDAMANRDIRGALFGQACGTATQYLVTTALAIHLVTVSGSGSLWLLSFRYLPVLLLGPLSAVPTSVFGPRRALTTLFAGRALAIGAGAGVLAAGWPLGILVATTVVEAALGTACLPAAASAQVAAARTPVELSAASALGSNAKSVFEVLGALAAGFLSAGLAPDVVFAVTAGVALTGAAAALAFVSPRTGRTRAPTTALRTTLTEDWRMIRDPRIATTSGLAATRAANRAVWTGLAVLSATGFLNMGTAGVGDLFAAAAVGTVISIPVGVRLIGRARLGGTLALAIAGMGLSLVLIAVAGNAAAALVLIAVWGLSSAEADLSVGGLIPRVAARRVAGAVAINEACRNGAQAVAMAILPLTVSALGTRSAIAAWGALPIGVAILAKPSLDRVDMGVAEHLRILERVRALDLFRPLRIVELEQVTGSLGPRAVRAGEVLVREGDRDSGGMYIIDSGTAEVSAHGARLADLVAGDGFGEIALLHRIPRTATVTATSDGRVLELDRQSFIGAVSDFSAGEDDLQPAQIRSDRPVDLADALRALTLWPTLDAAGRQELLEAARVRSVEPGATLCTEGEAGTSAFVMLEGRAEVRFGDQVLADVLPGQAFGEISILHGVPRTASVIALQNSRIAVVSIESIRSVLGDAPAAGRISRRPG
jgi:CRP-like cAMP-binding protein